MIDAVAATAGPPAALPCPTARSCRRSGAGSRTSTSTAARARG